MWAKDGVLEVGQTVAAKTYNLSRDSLVRYAGASGDFNVIHYRDDRAQAVGLDGVLAHGMLTMGLGASLVSEWLGDAGWIQDYGVRFTKPVWVPADGHAEVSVAATVALIEEFGARVRLDLTVTCAGVGVLGKAQVWVRR